MLGTPSTRNTGGASQVTACGLCPGLSLAGGRNTGTLSRSPRAREELMCETAFVREQGKITVFLLDDHEVVRRGVHELLSVEDDIEVVGEAGTAADALVRIPATRPDVAVLDVRLPDGSGVEVCREIRSANEDIKCLMLTSYADDEALFDGIMAGASGYVLKAIRGQELLTAIRDVADGKSLLDPVAPARVLERLRDGGGTKDDSRLARLT